MMPAEHIKKTFKQLRPNFLRLWAKELRVKNKVRWLSARHNLLSHRTAPLIKRSDTLFILGNGSSISTYTCEQWEHIRQHDSLGLNFFTLHDFVPTTYMTEILKYPEDLICEKHILHNLEARSSDYGNIRILIKDTEKFSLRNSDRFLALYPPSLKRQTLLLKDIEIEAQTSPEFSEAINRLDSTGFFDQNDGGVLIRKRASVFLACILAIRARYKKIVLCGVDLNNSDYFYHSDNFIPCNERLTIPPNFQPGSTHKTNDPRYGETTISEILSILDEQIMKPRQITLSVALKSSALHPRFNSYF